MLAANGSIFTILAISFERYYAICEPLKAGYKCTRLRAIVIICAIWIITSILTSPILIMAKSAQTVYIDGSLVDNCILETDTYWPKLYVYASMFAFFCLPLIVLILVYWLISRRLIRENLTMSATTSLATNDSIEQSQQMANHTNCCQIHCQCDCSAHHTTGARMARLTKAASLKSISAFFSSLHHNSNHHHHHQRQQHHQQNDNQFIPISGTPENHLATRQVKIQISPRTNHKRRMLTSNRALSLDQHHLMIDGDTTSNPIKPFGGKIVELIDEHQNDHNNAADCTFPNKISCLKKSFANNLVYQLLNIKSNNPCKKEAVLHDGPGQVERVGYQVNSSTLNDCLTNKSNELDMDRSSQRPFLDMGALKDSQLFDEPNNKIGLPDSARSPGRNPGVFKFRWAKRFSISSSSASTQTNCTTLLSESSSNGHERSDAGSGLTPRSIIRRANSKGRASPIRRAYRSSSGRRIAHFSASPDGIPSGATNQCSSASETTASPYSSSKSPSPDSLIINEEKITFILEGHNEASVVDDNVKDLTSISCETSPKCVPLVDALQSGGDFAANGPNVNNGINGTKPQANSIARSVSSNDHPQTNNCDNEIFDQVDENDQEPTNKVIMAAAASNKGENFKVKLASMKGRSLDNHHHNTFSTRRSKKIRNHKAPICNCNQFQSKARLSELLVVQDLSKKQQMDSRRQVVIMLAFVVACFFLLFLPYRVFTMWLILSTEDQVQSLGMETYYNLTYFSRILIYLHSAINPIAYNLISTKFRRAFMSILLCRGASSRRQFTTEHRIKVPVTDRKLKKAIQT